MSPIWSYNEPVHKLPIVPLVVGLAVLLAPSAKGGSLALDIFENPGSTGSAGPQSLGWQFQVNTPILVDGLAFWNHTDTQNHDVGIYSDSTQLLLVSATVLPSDPQMGTGPWLVHGIAPFLLTPGVYDIAAETGTDNYTYAPTGMSTVPEITFLSDRYLFGNTVLAFPSQTSGVDGFFGPSFTEIDAPTPEPAPYILLGAGLLVLAGAGRLRLGQVR